MIDSLVASMASASAREIGVAALVLVGAGFTLVGALGLLRLPDFYMRLHAPTKASTLGVGGLLAASLLWRWTEGGGGLHELLLALFVFITAPVSANLLAQAALHARLPSRAPQPAGLAAAGGMEDSDGVDGPVRPADAADPARGGCG